MTGSVQPVAEGYHSVTPYLAVDDAAAAIAFYTTAFEVIEVMRMPAPGGKVGHAEIEIGGSRIMLADAYPDMGFRASLRKSTKERSRLPARSVARSCVGSS